MTQLKANWVHLCRWCIDIPQLQGVNAVIFERMRLLLDHRHTDAFSQAQWAEYRQRSTPRSMTCVFCDAQFDPHDHIRAAMGLLRKESKPVTEDRRRTSAQTA